MSFFFRMASRLRPSTPEEVVRSIKDSFLALNTRTHTKVTYPIYPPPLPPCFSRPHPARLLFLRLFFGDLEADPSMRARFWIDPGDGIGCKAVILSAVDVQFRWSSQILKIMVVWFSPCALGDHFPSFSL